MLHIGCSALVLLSVVMLASVTAAEPTGQPASQPNAATATQPAAELSRFEAVLEGYRKAGQPVELEDFKPAPVEPSNNMAAALKEANRLLSLDERQTHICNNPDPRWVQEQPDLVRSVLARNAEVLVLVRSTSEMTGVDWDLNLSDPMAMTNTATKPMRVARQLGYFLVTAAYWEALEGNDADSIACIGDILRVSQAVSELPTLLGTVASSGEDAKASNAIETALPYWDLKGACVQEQARKLMGRLLDDAGASVLARRAQWGDRALNLAMMEDYRTESRFTSRMRDADVLRIVERYTAEAEAFGQPSYPLAMKQLPGQRSDTIVEKVTLPMSSMVNSVTSELTGGTGCVGLDTHFLRLAMRRMAAVALAAGMFQADHGRPIANLAELVPAYLPGIPIDPFSPAGEPLRLAGDEPARVYSVNVDGIDGGGIAGEGLKKGDIVFHLLGGRPARPLEPLPSDPAFDPVRP